MENMENMNNNRKENEISQKVTDPFDADEYYLYEIDKNIYIASAFINLGKLGPVSSFIKVKTNEFVAIKKLSNVYENPNKGKNVLKQISILSFINHPNVIKLLDIIIPEKDDFQDIYLVEEYYGSNLEKVIDSNYYDLKKDEVVIPWIIYQILMGLNYLHSCKIMHRDIRSSNILIDEKGNIKICGFGNAISFNDRENTLRGETNDFISEKCVLTYQAPEILASKKKNNYDEKMDLWGVGCILAELYTNIIPFFPPLKISKTKWISQLNGIFKKLGKPSKDEIQKFASKERTKDIFKFVSFPKMDNKDLFPNIKDENVLDLLNKLLCINPKERISIKEAINHPFFDVIKDFKEKDDFNDSEKIFVNEYKEKIEEMEKRNALFNDKIIFYKNEMLYKQIKFHSL